MSITTYASIITRWPSFGTFAKDVGIPRKHAHAMYARDSIPPYYWLAVVKAADERGYNGITYELLVKLASKATLRVRRPTVQRKQRA
jgi:hypothetical protein